MYTLAKFLTVSAVILISIGCAVPELKLPEVPQLQNLASVLQSNERAEYTGTDNVGDIDSSMLIGTWKVENVNPIALEKDIDSRYTFNQDGSFSMISKADLGSALGKFEYDVKGTWSVDGEFVTITAVSATETTGNSVAAASPEEVFDEDDTFVGNLHEAGANSLVVYEEESKFAQNFTRLK